MFQDDEHLKAWLIRVTINRCNQLRRTASRHRTQPLPDDETLLPKTPPASAALMANEVWRVLDTLPPKYRAVVHLHYVEGYSTEEIAEIAKCRPSTVRSRKPFSPDAFFQLSILCSVAGFLVLSIATVNGTLISTLLSCGTGFFEILKIGRASCRERVYVLV